MYTWFHDKQRIIGSEVGDDKASISIDGDVSDESCCEAYLVAVQSAPVMRHEFDEVALWRLRYQAQTVAQRVLLGAESVVGWYRTRLSRGFHFRDALRRREVGYTDIPLFLRGYTRKPHVSINLYRLSVGLCMRDLQSDNSRQTRLQSTHYSSYHNCSGNWISIPISIP